MIKILLPVLVILYLFVHPYTANAQGDQTFTSGQVTPAIPFPSGGCTYHWVNSNPAIGLPASGTGTIPSFTAINNGGLPVTATITATPVPTGFAYISNFGDGTVSVINTVTNQVVAIVPVGAYPFGVTISSDSKRVYVANISGTISVINTGSNIVTATINAGITPFALCLSPDNSIIYVANNNANTISVGNTTTGQVLATIKVAPSPYALAISPDGSQLYVAHNTMAASFVTVINTADYQVTATIPVPVAPEGLAVSPDGSTLYATAVGSNLVSFINTQTNKITVSVPVGQEPEGITISPDGSTLYTANYQGNNVTVINAASGKVITTIPVGNGPTGICADPDGGSVYVTNQEDNTVSVISMTNNTVSAVVPVGKQPNSQGSFVSSATTCEPVTFTITIQPNPKNLSAVMATKLTGNLSGCVGNLPENSAVGQFTASGNNLSAPVMVTTSAGFEISLAQTTGFGTALDLPSSGKTLAPVTIYARLAAGNPVGQVNGEIMLTSAGAESATVALSAVVTTVPAMTGIANERYFNGDPVPALAFNGQANTFSWVNDTPGIGLPASGTGSLPAFTAVNNGTTPVVATIKVTPSQTGYAYIPNTASNDVTVINTTTNAVVATVPVGKFPNAAAVSPDGSKVYVVNQAPGQTGSVSVIDAATNMVAKTIPVGAGLWGVAITPSGSKAYVSNETSGTVSVINTSNQLVTAVISVQLGPVGVTASPDGQFVYVANSGSKSISVISTSTDQVINTIGVGRGPYVAQVTPDGSKLYVPNGSDNTVSVIDAHTYKTITTIATPGFPINITISPDGSLAYLTTNAAAELVVINTTSNTIINNIGVLPNPVGINITPDDQEIFVVGASAGKVGVYSTATDQLLGYDQAGNNPLAYGDFISSGSACSGEPQKFTITVYPRTPSVVAATGNLSPLSTTYGTVSIAESFQVSGSGIRSGILVTAPIGFEVSTDNSNFSSSVTINSLGTIAPVTIYIRLTAIAPVDTYDGYIVVSSTGATNAQLEMPASEVQPATLTITANNQSRVFHVPNPTFTVSYRGFENGDGPPQLTALPIVTTVATINYPPGTYTLVPSGAAAANYTPVYVNGTLTIKPILTLVIPNTFTPNGDGINDTWDIAHIEAYPGCRVSVFNRYGSLLFLSVGYAVPWNGQYNGAPVPSGTYYYIIDLRNQAPLLSGSLTVIR